MDQFITVRGKLVEVGSDDSRSYDIAIQDQHESLVRISGLSHAEGKAAAAHLYTEVTIAVTPVR